MPVKVSARLSLTYKFKNKCISNLFLIKKQYNNFYIYIFKDRSESTSICIK